MCGYQEGDEGMGGWEDGEMGRWGGGKVGGWGKLILF